MTREEPAMDLLTRLHALELTLLRQQGVRLRVDKVTPDGLNALCTAAQVERSFLRSVLPAEGLVAVCHEALASLYRVGLRPLVSAQPDPATAFKPLDADDPFQLRMALRTAGMDELLLPGYSLPPAMRSKVRTHSANKVLD